MKHVKLPRVQRVKNNLAEEREEILRAHLL